MEDIVESKISQAILDAYHAKLRSSLESDVVIVGAGPSGMVASWRLAASNFRAILLEKRLTPGGGIWGGSLGMNEAVVQREALEILNELEVRYQSRSGLFTVDAMELASALCLKALRAGAVFLNLITAEDVCVHAGRVKGVVGNRSILSENLPIDPIVFSTRAAIDATGHNAVLVNCLRERNLLSDANRNLPSREKPMDASAGENFVIENVTELFPGLWVTGMSVCAALGGPRMGPIFGGMLLSGSRVAEKVIATLGSGKLEAGNE